jgi:hypothetical protein
MVYNMTTFIGGISRIRDGIPSNTQTNDFLNMVAAGITLNVVASGASDKDALSLIVQVIEERRGREERRSEEHFLLLIRHGVRLKRLIQEVSR